MNKLEQNEKNKQGRKSWKAPAIRAVIPSKRTAGGTVAQFFQDDGFYGVS